MPSADQNVESVSAVAWRERIEAAKRGCRQSQNELLTGVRPLLLSLANQRVRPDVHPMAAPSDVVQDVLLQAWDGIGDFRGHTRGELIAWLKTILIHRISDEGRRRKHRDQRIEDPNQLGAPAQCREPIANGGPTASRHAIANEQTARIEHALSELPTRYEQAVRLRNELELSYREMGVALGCTEEAARKLWARAIERLGRLLDDGS